MALLVMEHPREVFRTELLAAALTVALLWSLVGSLGVLGAAYAYLAGNVVRMTGWWLAFAVLAAAHGNDVPKMGEPGLSNDPVWQTREVGRRIGPSQRGDSRHREKQLVTSTRETG